MLYKSNKIDIFCSSIELRFPPGTQQYAPHPRSKEWVPVYIPVHLKKDEIRSMNQLDKLVLDTLYNRRRKAQTSCFVVNEAGMELLKGDQIALPVIESILCDVVEPALKNLTDQQAIDLAKQLKVDVEFVSIIPFDGLSEVLGAYFVIGIKFAQEARIYQFLNQCSDRLLANAIATSPVYLTKMDIGYNFGVAPTDALAAFVKHHCSNDSERIRKAATRALQFLDMPTVDE